VFDYAGLADESGEAKSENILAKPEVLERRRVIKKDKDRGHGREAPCI